MLFSAERYLAFVPLLTHAHQMSMLFSAERYLAFIPLLTHAHQMFVLFSAERYLAFVPLLTHAHQPVYRLLSLSKASNTFLEIIQQLFSTQKQVPTVSRSKLYLRAIFYP